MNTLERSIKEKALDNGWMVYRSGWPDFLLYDLKTKTGVCIEVKSIYDKVSKAQKKMHAVLKTLGIETQIIISPDYVPKRPTDKTEP